MVSLLVDVGDCCPHVGLGLNHVGRDADACHAGDHLGSLQGGQMWLKSGPTAWAIPFVVVDHGPESPAVVVKSNLSHPR
jgi:hypothetical protein